MVKTAVIFANGCEEIEGLSIVDILRRLNIECDMIGLDSLDITGGHNIRFTCDKLISNDLLTYDMVALPGGMGGTQLLASNIDLQNIMKKRFANKKWNAAMCAAPLAFSKFGLLKQANYTCYPGFEKNISRENPQATFVDDLTVIDNKNKLITSRGPATAMSFAYAIAQTLQCKTAEIESNMLYTYLLKKSRD